MFHIMVLKSRFLYVTRYFQYSDIRSSLNCSYKGSVSQEWIIGMRFPLSKQYRYITDHFICMLLIIAYLPEQLPSYCSCVPYYSES